MRATSFLLNDLRLAACPKVCLMGSSPQMSKTCPDMNWIPSADRSEISRVFAVYVKRVNSA